MTFCDCQACRTMLPIKWDARQAAKTMNFSSVVRGYARLQVTMTTLNLDFQAGYAAFSTQNPDITQKDWENLPYTTRARWARIARAAYDVYVPTQTPAEVFALKMYDAAKWVDSGQTPLAADKERNPSRYAGYLRMAEFAMKHGASLENDTEDDDD